MPIEMQSDFRFGETLELLDEALYALGNIPDQRVPDGQGGTTRMLASKIKALLEGEDKKEAVSVAIGIDPGKKTGFAVTENGKLTILETVTFWKAYQRVRELVGTSEVSVVVIEVPHTKTNWHGPKAAHDVGRVCREAELLADGIELLGVEVIRQHPAGKVSQEYFARVTGWKKRTNEHVRDAGMLVYGRK